jgi:hypothetical protein
MMFRMLLITCLFSSSMFAQDAGKEYKLRGIDDTLPYSLNVQEDVINEITTLSTQANIVKIVKVQDIEKITVHENTFLEIQFRVRGGAGVKMRRKVLVCLSGGKVHRALDVISEVSSRVTEVYDKVADSLKLFDEKENYDLAVSIKKKGTVFKATLSESKKIESKYDLSRGESFENTYELDFDASGCFFYNSMKHLNKRYKVYSPRDNKAVEKFISMEVPCIQLYQSSYLLIDNEWCIDNGNDFLSCL